MFDFLKLKKPEISLWKHKKVKIGLAFGGGGARGYAHLGVIKAFEEYGLKFDFIAGTSAGSLAGAYYANGWSFAQLYDLASKFKKKEIRTSKIPFMPSSTEGIQKIIVSSLGDIDISESKIPLAIVATDILSTKECIITKGSLPKAVAGSCAIPAIFKPVKFGDKLLLDGGLQNTLPSDVPKLFGCDYVVAVDVHSARNEGAKSSKYFNILSATMRVLMSKSARLGYEHADVILAPETKRFKSTQLKEIDDMIDEGYREAVEKMPQILELFNRGPIPNNRKQKIEKNAIII
ncbi:MAG: patatin-like phospholipase family protein [Clostridia bacterium]|nr:patatin-like phospholipase family protein [Clostridia bacterium]